MNPGLALLLAALALSPAVALGAADRIGYVKMLSGSASVTSIGDGILRDLRIAAPIHEGDRVETGRDGQIGITFSDDTRITLGPNSRVTIDRFVFIPVEKKYGFVLRLAYGTLQYLSGLTERLAPDAMSIETPGSTIAVRGTRLLIRAAKTS